MINCVLIEDELLAQKGLIKLINQTSLLKLIAVFDDIDGFEKYLQANPNNDINLLFLDIELPKLNGITYLKNNNLEIPVIITTAYNQYAIEGYELNVVDYLLKPIDIERFLKAIKKAEQYISYLGFRDGYASNFFYIKSDKVLEKVFFDDINYVEAMRNYVIFHLTNNKRIISYNSLKNVSNSLPKNLFIKVQKSFIANRSKINKIEKGSIFINDFEIKLNREHKNEIIQKLLGLDLM